MPGDFFNGSRRRPEIALLLRSARAVTGEFGQAAHLTGSLAGSLDCPRLSDTRLLRHLAGRESAQAEALQRGFGELRGEIGPRRVTTRCVNEYGTRGEE